MGARGSELGLARGVWGEERRSLPLSRESFSSSLIISSIQQYFATTYIIVHALYILLQFYDLQFSTEISNQLPKKRNKGKKEWKNCILVWSTLPFFRNKTGKKLVFRFCQARRNSFEQCDHFYERGDWNTTNKRQFIEILLQPLKQLLS